MAAQVLSLFHRLRSRDWTQNELAQFYRVEAALVQAGLQLETDRGLTDEGDPWFVFCRQDNGDVFIHFARIDGAYIAVGAALEQVVHGKDFAALVEEMIAAQAFAMARQRKHSSIFMHPAALLIALVGGAFFHSGQAKAAETHDHVRPEMKRHAVPVLLSEAKLVAAAPLDPTETATILSGVLTTLNDTARFSWTDTVGQQVSASVAALPVLTDMIPLSNLAIAAAGGVGASSSPAASATVSAAVVNQHFDLATLHLLTPTIGGASLAVTMTPIGFDHALGGGAAVSAQAALSLFNTAAAAVPVPNVAVLVQASSSDAAQTLKGADVLNDAQPTNQAAAAPVALASTLQGLLDQGTHFFVSPGDPANTSGSSDSHGAGSSGTHVVVPPATPVVTPPVGTAAPPSDGSLAPIAVSANSPEVTVAIQHFSAEVGALDVGGGAQAVVLYDGTLFANPSAIPTLNSVTFTFADGSSISLVGTPAEIQNLHLS